MNAESSEPARSGEDEVDRLVAAWRRERPDLDVSPLEVLSRVTRLARHLDRARRTAFAERGLETWEFDVLSALPERRLDALADLLRELTVQFESD